jgi:hypothetical protein
LSAVKSAPPPPADADADAVTDASLEERGRRETDDDDDKGDVKNTALIQPTTDCESHNGVTRRLV